MHPREFARYLGKRIRHEGVGSLKGLLYLSAAVAALVAFAVLMPSLEYRHVRGYQAANWDIWATGPIGQNDVDSIGAIEGVERVVPAVTVTVDEIVDGDGQPTDGGAITAIAVEDVADLHPGPYPDSLLIKGERPSAGELACDWETATLFDLHVGDELLVTLLPLGDKVTVRGRLAGIYGPTAGLDKTIVVPYTSELRASLDEHDVGPYTDLFVTSSEREAVSSAVWDSFSDREVAVITRSDAQAESRSRLAEEVGPFLRNSATWVAMVGLVALALWQQSTRLARRRGEYAVLAALGMSRNGLIALDAAEQAARLTAAVILGTAGAIALTTGYNHMYVPRGALAGALGALGLAVVLTMLIGAWSVRRDMTRHPLADSLAKEAV